MFSYSLLILPILFFLNKKSLTQVSLIPLSNIKKFDQKCIKIGNKVINQLI